MSHSVFCFLVLKAKPDDQLYNFCVYAVRKHVSERVQTILDLLVYCGLSLLSSSTCVWYNTVGNVPPKTPVFIMAD